ncbi:hypothetical protein PENTCL1PPCAC_27962, partial [Pristionchus entomophagus]
GLIRAHPRTIRFTRGRLTRAAMNRKKPIVGLTPTVAALLSSAERRERDIMEPEQERLVGRQDEDAPPPPIHQTKYTRFFRTPKIGSRRIRNRLVQKQGICNISLKNVPKQRRKYFSDIFTTIIEMKWRWCLLFFSFQFAFSWCFFSCIYYTIAYSHGDFVHTNDTNWKPCIGNVQSGLNVFIFSFTTQTTIDTQLRYPTDECTLVVLTMCVQFMWGVMSQTLMAGVIFSKLARPIKRAATLIFSKNAVICLRDGKLCLLFRVGDMRKSSLAEAHVRLQMIKRCITYEGELLPFHQFDMDVGYDQGLDRVFVIWPITICHEIDENSPLYEVSMESLQTDKFEIIAILEGVVESVGSTTQARTSYLPSEILWGKRFEKLVHYKKENGQYNIDYAKFHNVYDIKTPKCSAKELEEMREAGMYDEREYQLLPPDGRGCIRLLDENQLLNPVNEPAEQTDTDEPPGQILRIDSDIEDNDTDEGNLELVDYGFRKKSMCVDKKLSIRSSHVSLAQSPSHTSAYFRSPPIDGSDMPSTSHGCRCTANGCGGISGNMNSKRYSHQDTLQPPSPHMLRHINSLPPSPTENRLSTDSNEILLPTRPVSHMTYRTRDRVSSAGSAELQTDESKLVDGF